MGFINYSGIRILVFELSYCFPGKKIEYACYSTFSIFGISSEHGENSFTVCEW